MRCILSWKLIAIGASFIINYCQALQQEIGDECTNKDGIVGQCQIKNNCSKDADLGAICNFEQTIICCATNILRNKQHTNLSNDQKEDRPLQSRFGFIPDFFHAPILPQKQLSDINYFNSQKYQNPNILHPNSNNKQFIEERPFQNYEQSVATKPNKKKTTSTRPTNEFGYYNSNNNQNLNNENTFNNGQTTANSQNYYNNPNQNHETYQSSPNNYPNYNTKKPNQGQNNNNRPYYETNPTNQNNNNNYPTTLAQKPYQNHQINNNYQSNYGTYESNQNNYPSSISQGSNQYNNFQSNTNHQANVQKPENYYNSGNNENNLQFSNSNNGYNENYNRPNNNQNNRPNNNSNRPNYNNNSNKPNNNQNINNRPTSSSSILFPDSSTTDNPYTQFTTTKKYNGFQNRPYQNTKRISEIKCEEYSKPLTTTVSVLPLSIDTSAKPVSKEKCSSKSVGLIVGGTKAELGEFPHMVAVGFNTGSGNPWNCGGTLISERYVLTAAHCTHSSLGSPVRVKLGDLNLQKDNDGAHPIEILVDDIIVHPDYVTTSKYNDIALIRLNKAVKFNDHIRPACLYKNDHINDRKVTATGWGSIEYGDRSSDDLLKVNLDVIDNQRCNQLYEAESKTNTLKKGIIDSMVCAGDLAGGHDTCLGDSGGPLVIRSEKNVCVFNLVGITSFGKYCATENSPGVYTRVSAFLPWIEQIVWT